MEKERGDTEWLEESKEALNDLLNWNDELPEEFMDTPKPGYSRHKYRSNWFQGVCSNVSLVADILNDPQLLEAAENLAQGRRTKDFKSRTTREEINEADALMRRALEKLNNVI